MDSTKDFLSKNKYFMIFLVFVLGLAVFAWAIWLIGFSSSQPLSNIKVVQGKTYINEKGEKWGPLPQGDYKFQVSSNPNSEGPVFLEGEIDPPDVHVGDTQKMRVVVQSSVGIKSVTAYIETDNGEKVVPLIKTGTVAFKDMLPEKYVVEADGNLKILSRREIVKLHKQKIAAEKKRLINPAQAQSGLKESWEASWVVHDTHNTTYRTTFVAEDNAGQTDSLTIAWSDLCGIPWGDDWNINLNGHCTISVGQIDGVDDGTVTIEDFDLTVEGTFAFNPGEEIKMIPGGKIIMGGGEIKKTNLWMCDSDRDGYLKSNEATIYAQDNAHSTCAPEARRGIFDKALAFFSTPKAQADVACGPTTYYEEASRKSSIRVGSAVGDDCYGGSLHAHPNSTAYCNNNRGDGSFDYNCDSNITYESTKISSINCINHNVQCYYSCPIQSGTEGWSGSYPDCGYPGTWLNGCTNTDIGGEVGEGIFCHLTGNKYACTSSQPKASSPRRQGCR